MRFVASFPPLFTTSGNVFCLKISGVWELLWVFKVVRWTHDRCMKINKSPTVSNGIGALSFEIWTANLALSLTMATLTNSWSFIFGDSNWKFRKVGYPVGTQKPDIQMQTFLTCESKKLKMLYFWVKKIKTCWIYKNTVFANCKKYEMSWNFCLVFITDFWSFIPGSLDTVTSLCMGFRSERAAAG